MSIKLRENVFIKLLDAGRDQTKCYGFTLTTMWIITSVAFIVVSVILAIAGIDAENKGNHDGFAGCMGGVALCLVTLLGTLFLEYKVLRKPPQIDVNQALLSYGTTPQTA